MASILTNDDSQPSRVMSRNSGVNGPWCSVIRVLAPWSWNQIRSVMLSAGLMTSAPDTSPPSRYSGGITMFSCERIG